MVEIVFLMLVLKLPILYLIAVVWWAVRAEPRPPEPAVLPAETDPDLRGGPRRDRGRRPTRGGPHGGGRPARRTSRTVVR
jgi:hypothetical protein